jgi:hypothetical protein
LDREVLESLPYGSEVVINLDMAGLAREVGKVNAGDMDAEFRLNKLFGGNAWRGVPNGKLDRAYAETFERNFKDCKAYPLRQSGSQRRSLIHLTNSPKAVPVFAKAHKVATVLNTLIAGSSLSIQQKDIAAKELYELFKGQTVTTRDMRSVSGRFDLVQLRSICAAADVARYGRWSSKTLTMEWFASRAPEPPPPTLGL